MQQPLLSRWRIIAPELPEHLLPEDSAPAFSLPGAEALLDFADLLGDQEPEDGGAPAEDALPSAPFPLPALLPDSVSGEASLCCEVDFGALSGDRAVLTFAQLLGRGSILLGDTPVAAFDSVGAALSEGEKAFALSASPCAFAADMTDALRRGRRETITIRFDGVRPAGVCGPVFLQTTRHAALSRLTLIPDAAQQTVAIRAQITAQQAGSYALRALPVPPDPGQALPPARELSLSLAAGESRQADMTIALPGGRFVPGKSYASAVVKIQLLRRDGGRRETLCDSASLACGYPGRAPLAFLPLGEDDLLAPPEELHKTLTAMNICAVSLRSPAPEAFYLRAARAGVSVIQQLEENSPHRKRLLRHPCLTFAAADDAQKTVSPAAAAWQLCSMTGYSRAADDSLSDRALLYEAAGRSLDPQDEGVRGVLEWLVAVSARLRCEAARQGRFSGALCESGAWRRDDVSAAIRTAFAPLHLSALPLCGAWWTGTRFSAALEAFIPEGTGSGKPLSALAVLEDEEGTELSRLFMPCRAKGGYVGVIDAQLPDHPCVLELRTQLLCADEVIEESTIPVYVGERGPLEAAFS